MKLLIIPEIGDGKSFATAIRPDTKGMPEFAEHGRSLGQASSMKFGVTQGRLCYSMASDQAIDALLKAHEGGPLVVAREVGRVCSDADAAKIHRALLTQHPGHGERMEAISTAKLAMLRVREAGSDATTRERDDARRLRDALTPHLASLREFHDGPRSEMVAAYREIALAEEARERVRRNIVGLTVFESDGFSGTSAAIHGRTMDAAGGGAASVWAGSGAVSVAGGVAVATIGNGGNWLGGGAAAGDQMAGIRYATFDTTGYPTSYPQAGVYLRATDLSNAYLFITGAAGRYFGKYISGAFTMIHNGGGAASAGELLEASATGSSLSLFIDSVLNTGPDTDSSYATGIGGSHINGTVTADDYYWSIASGGFTPNPHRPTNRTHLRR